MRLAIGLLRPHEGAVFLLGRDPYRYPGQRLGVGYLPQHFQGPSAMPVIEYLTCLALLAGVERRAAARAVLEALETVGLRERSKSPLGTLSGGMLRRVGLAQALVHEPRLLIVDEPAAGLDPQERVRLYDTLRQASAHRPVLVSSHLVEEVEREADWVWIMAAGELVWTGRIAEAVATAEGRVREGILPQAVRPDGQVVLRRPQPEGVLWRVIGGDGRLAPARPTLLDAYLLHVGRREG